VRVLKPTAKAFWGGYNGYFADPDGWQLDKDGHVKLPE
jgi:hypothetical protein